ncbi:MAG: helix-turn-helix domain-containing protein [Wenzhouxiangellaceae bacterium]
MPIGKSPEFASEFSYNTGDMSEASACGRDAVVTIRVDLDVMPARRKMNLNDLAEAVGITPQNLWSSGVLF